MKALYGPLLPPTLTPVDWYAFDVTAAWVALELRNGGDGEDSRSGAEQGPRRRQQSGPIQQDGQETVIRGTEIPPWGRK